jgi:hypothetical protein
LNTWGFCQPKTAPTRLGEVSYHWALGEQQGGYRNRLHKVFQPLTHAAFAKLDPQGASKTSGDFADPLAVFCCFLNALD